MISALETDEYEGIVADDGTAARRWVGSGSLPGHFGLWDFSGPFVVVEVARSRVTVRLQPKFLARLLGVTPLVAEPGSGLRVTTSRYWGGLGWYIGFRLPDELPYTHLTTPTRKNAILCCLAEAGFEAPAGNAAEGGMTPV
jgi:hypothetical protein